MEAKIYPPKMALQDELKWLRTLSLSELEDAKDRFLNDKQLISHDLEMGKLEGKTKTVWYVKASQAYKIYHTKLETVNQLIKRKYETDYIFYKKFYELAQKVLTAEDFEKLRNFSKNNESL